ncbi:MAG TPA: alpha/beta-hydrolase family protein [Acidimicrobiia bacterium]|nr:alpha/beta-hydrolase family protein [Acidimicrobiia bacterium]
MSRPGVLAGLLMFVLSLWPSLLPKLAITQGIVSGISFMVGYGLGAGWGWAWNYLGLSTPRRLLWVAVRWLWFAVLTILLGISMWNFVGWQNDLREKFGMEPISVTIWLTIVPVAFVVSVLILTVVRSLRRLFGFLTRWLGKVFPRRLARLLGGLGLILMVWSLWSGVLVNTFFAVANQIFAPRDTVTAEGITQPASELRSGSPESLVVWDTLGEKGRTFVATGPTVAELNAFHGGGAMEPIRVYAGLRSADTVEERAQLVLDELIRTGAFDRQVLVVATTTGTGFLEPNAITALEYVHNGDVAVAGAQYSYLPSWISLLADQDEVKQTSETVFATIHDYLSTLPEEERPEIYLYGLSLGAYGVEAILTSINIVNEPIDGALMVGPPFVNELWNELVANRDPGSSPSTPLYQGGRTVRFTNGSNPLDLPGDEEAWGETRVVYLQHASDPVVFFSPSLFLDQPDWLLDGQRGAELSRDFHYARLITGWQVMMDLPAAGSVPEGYGHLYTRQANAEAWIAVTRPDGWTGADTERLTDFLTDLDPPG